MGDKVKGSNIGLINQVGKIMVVAIKRDYHAPTHAANQRARHCAYIHLANDLRGRNCSYQL